MRLYRASVTDLYITLRGYGPHTSAALPAQKTPKKSFPKNLPQKNLPKPFPKKTSPNPPKTFPKIFPPKKTFLPQKKLARPNPCRSEALQVKNCVDGPLARALSPSSPAQKSLPGHNRPRRPYYEEALPSDARSTAHPLCRINLSHNAHLILKIFLSSSSTDCILWKP